MRPNAAPLRRRTAGLLLTALGVLALTAPLAVGQWSLALLGIPLMVLSLVEAYSAFTSTRRTEIAAYVPSVLAMLAGNLLLLSSALVLNGLLILLFAILLFDGLSKIFAVGNRSSSARFPIIVNGLIDFASAALLWYLNRILGAERAVGIVIGIFILAAGWRLLVAPVETAASHTGGSDPTVHPDIGLGLPPNEAFARLHAEIDGAASAVRATDLL